MLHIVAGAGSEQEGRESEPQGGRFGINYYIIIINTIESDAMQ